MAPYSKKPTWAILPYSKTIPGSKAIELLGCVVADVENPTDHYVPRDPSAIHSKLPKVLEVEDTDANFVLNSTRTSHVDTRLAQIFRVDAGRQTGDKRSAAAQTVITRFLVDHPRVFKTLVEDDACNREILEMMDWNPVNKKTAYMVVGVKTCLDMKTSEVRSFDDHSGAGAELPLEAALAASGIMLPVGIPSLGLGASINQSKMRGLLSAHTAVGERIFAIQYRQIKRHRDWLKWNNPSTLSYGDLEHVSSDVGLFGDSDEEEFDTVEKDGQQAVGDADLEIGDGLAAGTALSSLLIVDM
jgi:hypothetical protein